MPAQCRRHLHEKLSRRQPNCPRNVGAHIREVQVSTFFLRMKDTVPSTLRLPTTLHGWCASYSERKFQETIVPQCWMSNLVSHFGRYAATPRKGRCRRGNSTTTAQHLPNASSPSIQAWGSLFSSLFPPRGPCQGRQPTTAVPKFAHHAVCYLRCRLWWGGPVLRVNQKRQKKTMEKKAH